MTLTIGVKHMESYLPEKGGAPERASHWMWAAINEGMSFAEFYPV